MGYLTRFTGYLNFSRPLKHGEVKQVPEGDLFGLDVWEDEEDTDDGRIIRKSAEGIEVKWEEPCKGYDSQEQLQNLIDALPADVEVRGEIRCDGEQTGDISRYVVRDRKVISETPKLTWPDGTTEPAGR